MKRKTFKLGIGLVLAICVFGYLTFSLFKSVKSEALEQTQKTDVSILKMIEDSISLCSVEYNYEDYITRKKTWAFELNPSIKYAKFTGKIKVGCEIKSVKKESNKFSIVLSEPSIVEHEINRIGDWKGKEGIWNNFAPNEEGKVIDEQKKIIEKRLAEQLQEEDKKRNKELISDLLVKLGENEDSFSITYVKK
jgi:hypothetical protein